MKFKVLSGSETYAKLSAVKERIDQVVAAAKELRESLHAKDHLRSTRYVAGGIDGIIFEQQPEGWKKVYANQISNCYYPRSIPKNKALLQQLAALPRVTDKDVNEPIDFHWQVTEDFTVVNRCGIVWGPEYHLVSVYEKCQYQPKADMIEITCSEYQKLEKAINDENPE